jgi:hypothetical protein
MNDQTPMRAAPAALLHAVNRCRRRLVLVTFARYAGLASGVALSAAVLTSRLAADTGWLNPWLALGAALLMSGAAALVGRPSLRDTSAAIDRRLALADLVTAGMEVRARTDPMATLVVRAAAARVGQCAPARLFPVRIGRREGLSLALAAAALVILTADVMRTPRGAQEDGTTASGATAAA